MLSYAERSAKRFYEPDLPYLTISQKQYELDRLIDVYIETHPSYVLEIGTQQGGTLYQWIKHADEDTKIVNIDILQDQSESILDVWQSWHEELVTIVEYSHLAGDRVRAELPWIDFLFIDGDHSYEGAKLDFLTYGPMVRPGGVIAFHDLITPQGQEHIQVGKLWREIQHAGYTTQEFWAEEKPSWGGIGVVYVQTQEDFQGLRGEREGLIQTFRPLWQSRYLPDMRGEEIAERETAA